MKKILIIAFLIMIIITFYQIGQTFSYYKNEIGGNYLSPLGIWSIKINKNQIAKTQEPTRFELTNEFFHYVDSNLVVNNKVAPGRKMYVDFIIDPTDTDVSIKYDVDMNFEEGSCFDVVDVENYIESKDGTNQVKGTVTQIKPKVYSSVLPVEEIQKGKVAKIRTYLIWKNDEKLNDRDTTLGKTEGKKLSIPMEVKFEQYMGEEIKVTQNQTKSK